MPGLPTAGPGEAVGQEAAPQVAAELTLHVWRHRPVVERELRKGLRKHDWNEALRYLDQALTSGRLLRLRRTRSAEAGLVTVNLRPDLDIG